MTTVVENITLTDLNKLEGYVEEPTKSPYELKRLRNSEHLLILYTTRKLVIQGSGNPFSSKKIQTKKTPSSKTISSSDLKECIGSDETLKGDTFGGLIVCGAYFKQDEVDVKDSKSYTDEQIIALAKHLLKKYPKRFCVKELTPEQYNELYGLEGSQTTILNLLHEAVGKELKKNYDALQVVDKYPGCIVGDVQLSKAESIYTSVAAASIIARYKGILQFQNLSKQAGFTLPKGSTHVKEAVTKIKGQKLQLGSYCKVHFSTVKS